MKKVIWMGNCVCNMCQKEITDVLYDSTTKYGCWATMCETCYKKHGIGNLGLGLGQKYKINKDKKFEKIEG